MSIKKWNNAGCLFCSTNPSANPKSAYWLEDTIRIKGLGSGYCFVAGGICKRHFDMIGKKYLKLVDIIRARSRVIR
jgi:hypothetical protein